MILSIVSCKNKHHEWTWQADFWAADHVAQDIMNQNEETVNCWDPEFDNYACLSYDNIEQLEANIEKMRDNYNHLINFNKSILRDMIKSRKAKNEDTSDLEAALVASEKAFKLIE